MRSFHRFTSALRVAATLAIALGASRAGAQQAPSNDSVATAASKLFAAVAGRWSCAGGFPNGRTLAADLSFTPAVDGRVVAFEHVDRAPGTYWQRATWALEAKSTRLASVAVTGSARDRAATPTLFVARTWTPTSVTFDADTIKAPPFAPNRFTYTVTGAAALKMVWEVNRTGAWALGDSLVCTRAP